MQRVNTRFSYSFHILADHAIDISISSIMCKSCGATFTGASRFLWHACWKIRAASYMPQREKIVKLVDDELQKAKQLRHRQERGQNGALVHRAVPPQIASQNMNLEQPDLNSNLGVPMSVYDSTASQLYRAQPFNSINTMDDVSTIPELLCNNAFPGTIHTWNPLIQNHIEPSI